MQILNKQVLIYEKIIDCFFILQAIKLYEISDTKSCGFVEKLDLNILKSILSESIFQQMLDIFFLCLWLMKME